MCLEPDMNLKLKEFSIKSDIVKNIPKAKINLGKINNLFIL
jgi:hypothetical protein